MSRSRDHRARRIIAATLLLFTLLVVLVPPSHHITVAMACPVLAMVFLFGTINVPFSLWVVSAVSEAHPPQAPDLPSRFQRPPPAAL
jgi:predicted MFS family arabinose efflux permease